MELKHVLRGVVGLALSLVAVSASAQAVDTQFGKQTLTLTQQYQKLSGTLGTTPIAAATLAGDAITFTVGSQVYSGRLNGETMTGNGWSATRSR